MQHLVECIELYCNIEIGRRPGVEITCLHLNFKCFFFLLIWFSIWFSYLCTFVNFFILPSLSLSLSLPLSLSLSLSFYMSVNMSVSAYCSALARSRTRKFCGNKPTCSWHVDFSFNKSLVTFMSGQSLTARWLEQASQ